MNIRQLIRAFEDWSAKDLKLVLASVYATEGSTYSKTGAQMLIDGDGFFQGMLSGGCLEGDLAERARQVLDAGVPQVVTYDLGRDDEELWGLGVGCDGLMRIFLQPLLPDDGYEPFTAMIRAYTSEVSGVAATVLGSGAAGLTPGMTMVMLAGETVFCDVDAAFADGITAVAQEQLAAGMSETHDLTLDPGSATVLFTVLRPPPRILVLGAGLDAQPLVRLAAELGWRITVQDHRPAYIEAGDFAAAEEVVCRPATEIAATLDLARFDATIVMSHHLATDREYLRVLADSAIPYIGLLGPIHRSERLLEELGDVSTSLESRVHGPAGLDLGGRGPAAIALSIIAEMHQHLMKT